MGDAGEAPRTFYVDADGDGSGSGAETVLACEPPPGFVENTDDCDDSPDGGASARPGALEQCTAEERDENCNGLVNEGCACPAPGDERACCAGRGAERCDETDGGTAWGQCSVMPEPERCNGIDDDCDGQVDELGPGLCAITAQVCANATCGCPAGQALCGNTCVSTLGTACSAGVGACLRTGTRVCAQGAVKCSATAGAPQTEVACNGVDENCNGAADDSAGAPQWFHDCDGDGYGAPGTATRACTRPTRCNGRLDSANGRDCNDTNGLVNPAQSATQQCGTDKDCDGDVYENVACEPNQQAVCFMCPETADIRVQGRQTCTQTCSYPTACSITSGPLFGPHNFVRPEPALGYFACTQIQTINTPTGAEYEATYRQGGDCGWLGSESISLPPGSYTLSFDNYDYAQVATPMVQVVVRDGTNGTVISSVIASNTNAGWERKTLAFSIGYCRVIKIWFIGFGHTHQGVSYVGGNRLARFDLVRN